MKRIFAAALAAMLLFAVLTGCSKRTYRTVDEIKASGELIMLTNAAFEPFEYIAGGKPDGVDVELAQMIADELGVKLTIVDMEFNLLVDALASGKGDIIAAGMTAREDRAKMVDFSDPYVNSTLKIIVPAGSDISSPDDLNGLVISLQEGTTSDLFVADYVDAADVLRFSDAIVAGNAVTSGKADACVLDELPAQGVVANSNGKLVLLEENLTTETFSMAVGKGNNELLEIVNSVLAPAFEDGTVDELVEKHMAITTGG